MKVTRLLLIVVAVLAGACTSPGATHYEAVLDELAIPPTWEFVHTTTTAPGAENDCVEFLTTDCPRVVRYYLVDGMPIDAYPQAKRRSSTQAS